MKVSPSLPNDTNVRRARSRLVAFLDMKAKELTLSSHDIQVIINITSAFWFRPTADLESAKVFDGKTIISLSFDGVYFDGAGRLTIRRKLLDGGTVKKLLDLEIVLSGEDGVLCSVFVPYYPDAN